MPIPESLDNTQCQHLISLTIAPELEEAIVDFLLTFESEQGFKSYSVNSHHHVNEGLSLAEQVSGRQRRVCLEMYLSDGNCRDFVERLRRQFNGAGIEYRILPVIDSGRF